MKQSGTQICSGYTKAGVRCNKRIGVNNTSGYCRPEHRDNHMKFKGGNDIGSAISAKVGKGISRTNHIKTYSSDQQGFENGNLYSNFSKELFPPLDRDVVQEKSHKNWANPEVRNIASRYGLMSAQKEKNDKIITNMESIIKQRIIDKIGKDKEGVYSLTDDYGRAAGSVESKFVPGNFSEKNFKKNVFDELGDEYTVTKLDSQKLKNEHPDAYDSMKTRNKESLVVKNSDETNESIEYMYMDRYENHPINEDNLKYWKTATLGHEVFRIKEENRNLSTIMESDKSDLLYALPADSYSVVTETGFSTDLKIKPGNLTFRESNLKNLAPNVAKQIKDDSSLWKKSYTSTSVAKGDKINETNYHQKGKAAGGYKYTFMDS